MSRTIFLCCEFPNFVITSFFLNKKYIIATSFPIVNKKSEFIIKNRHRILGGGTRNLCTGAQNLPQKSLKICCNLLLTPQNYDKIKRPWINPLQRVHRSDTSVLHFVFALWRRQYQFCTSLSHFGAKIMPQIAVLRHSLAFSLAHQAFLLCKGLQRPVFLAILRNFQKTLDTPVRVC